MKPNYLPEPRLVFMIKKVLKWWDELCTQLDWRWPEDKLPWFRFRREEDPDGPPYVFNGTPLRRLAMYLIVSTIHCIFVYGFGIPHITMLLFWGLVWCFI